jgi:ABC-2 type transporter
VSLLLFLAIGALAFRAVGLIVASVANSVAESTVLVQLLYMPMLFLSGAMMPTSMMPRWTQSIAQFVPASYLVSGMQSIVTEQRSLVELAGGGRAGPDARDGLKSTAKLWVAVVLAPFVVLGVYQFRTREQIVHNRILWRQLQRDELFLIRNARVFAGDGRIVDPGSVLVRKGRIEAVYDGAGPDPATLTAEAVEPRARRCCPV